MGDTILGCIASSIKVEAFCTKVIICGNSGVSTTLYGIECFASFCITINGNGVDGSATALKAVMLYRSYPASIIGNIFMSFNRNAVLIHANTVVIINLKTGVGCTFDSINDPIASQLSGGATLGEAVRTTGNVPYSDILNPAEDVRQISGVGSPEGTLGCGPGSILQRTDTGALYIKATGVGLTGWKLVTQIASS